MTLDDDDSLADTAAASAKLSDGEKNADHNVRRYRLQQRNGEWEFVREPDDEIAKATFDRVFGPRKNAEPFPTNADLATSAIDYNHSQSGPLDDHHAHLHSKRQVTSCVFRERARDRSHHNGLRPSGNKPDAASILAHGYSAASRVALTDRIVSFCLRLFGRAS
jgi:hypothetical protein